MDSQFFWLDYSRKDAWRDWLLRLPHDKQDVYYDPDYLRLYAEDDIGANCYIYAKGKDVYIYPFIMRPVPQVTGYFDISTPYGYGGPIFSTKDVDFLQEANQCFLKESFKKNIVAELIKFHPLLGNHSSLYPVFKGDIKKTCSTVYVDINIDEEHRWKNIYTHANRKNINKARRSNIEITIGQSDECWQAFKRLYEVTMKVNQAENFYFFSPEYFKNIQKHLANNYVLVSCRIDGEIVSVLLVLLSKVYAYCHLIGTDRDFMNLGVNHLLHHELILWCKKNGYEKLLIGGGRGDSNDDSLLRFKKNFSDKIADMYVGEYVLNSEVYNEACLKWSQENHNKPISNRLLKYRL